MKGQTIGPVFYPSVDSAPRPGDAPCVALLSLFLISTMTVMANMTPVLQIEPALATLLPPLTETESEGLEQDILVRGILSPLVVWNGILVDGHHRHRICRKHGLSFPIREIKCDNLDAAKFWAWQHQANRRNRTAYQRAEIALTFKPQVAAKAKERQRAAGGDRKSEAAKSVHQNSVEPITQNETQKELAAIADMSHDTIRRVEFLNDHADEKTKEKLRAGNTTINTEYKRLKKEVGRQERDLKKQATILLPAEDRVQLFTASVAAASEQIETESVDWIITDPPYPKEYGPVYGHLAELAQHALKPGGSLLCMVGQSYLPDIVRILAEKLDYHWTLAYWTPGGQATQLWERKVNTFWKPILWFTKGA
ncbi:MAG: hypothetical protein ACRCUY_00215, partial [Thermoguttaceae bacterium]